MLLAAGLPRVMPRTGSRRHWRWHYGIDNYLADLDRAVDAPGGRVALMGLCQEGWL